MSIDRETVARRKSRRIAERVLGRKLAPHNRVHHFDKNVFNNDNNLVICEDQRYHFLLHIRTDAYKATGNANFRKCGHCFKYDDPNLMIKTTSFKKERYFHYSCNRAVCKKADRIRRASILNRSLRA